MLKSIRLLTKFEIVLWAVSVAAIAGTAILFKSNDPLSICASLIGVSALIFVAKGLPLGQLLTIVFAVFYGIISFIFRYYGEMITYLCMSAPAAFISLISWLRHPYQDTEVVEVARLSAKKIINVILVSGAVTLAFYFILGWLDTASLYLSTLSVTTSMLASMLTAYRSRFYALAYAANDVVLIGLWIVAAITDISCVPMVACFIMFFANDLYGFYNWGKMMNEQKSGS